MTGVGIFSIFLMNACSPKSPSQDGTISTDTIATIKDPILKYGLPVDSFNVEDGIVRNNEYLSKILNERGVSMATIDQIARKSKDVFDVRKIKSGGKYALFCTPDSLNEARYFVYENSAVDYTIFELFDTLGIYQSKKDIEIRKRTAQGVVESSLWNTMDDNGLDPVLALRMENIYQWSVDFFAIQKGDRFRMIFDEYYVDSTYVGIGEVYAAEFDTYGTPNYAFLFSQNDTVDYFDENGKSLRKAFLKAPLDFFRISSRFSNSRMHPVLRIRRAHHGVDYAAPSGTPVKSIGEGTVIAKAYQANGGGNYLKIKHNSVYTTTYMHLKGFAKGIVVGKRVRQGEVIGYVGATGLATGPHLDFRVHQNGSPVDPLKVKAPPGKPIKEENMPHYTILKDSMMNELEKIKWADEQFLLEGGGEIASTSAK